MLGLSALFLSVAITTSKLRGHVGITAIIAGGILVGLVAFDNNIFPMWIVVISAGCFIAGIISERSPSL